MGSYSVIAWGAVPAGTAALITPSALAVATGDGSGTLQNYGELYLGKPLTSGAWSGIGNAGSPNADFYGNGKPYDVFLSGGSSVSFKVTESGSFNSLPCNSFPSTSSGGGKEILGTNDSGLSFTNRTSATDCVWFRFLFYDAIGCSISFPGADCLLQAVAVYSPGSTPPLPYTLIIATKISLVGATNTALQGFGATGAAPAVSFEPSGAPAVAITWSSDSNQIATVDPNSGVITAVSAGSAHIIATALLPSELKLTASKLISVTVPPLATGLSLNPSSPQTVLLKDPAPVLTAQIQPLNTDVKTLTWLSSETSVATVDSTGKVILVGPGTTIITASTTDGSNHSARVTITVAAPSVKISSISFNGVSNVLLNTLSQPYAPKFTVTPSNASTPALVWSSDTKEVARVNAATGAVMPLSNGTAVITATANDGGTASASFKVTVAATAPSVRISSISFNGVSNVPLNTLNQPYTPTFTIMPSNASNPALTWSSDTQAVASVNAATGTVTPLSYGTAVITATANDGSNVSATLTVVVKDSGKVKPKTKGHRSAVPMNLILIIAGGVVFLGVALAVFFVHRKRQQAFKLDIEG